MAAPPVGGLGEHRVEGRRRPVDPQLPGGDHPAAVPDRQVDHPHHPVVAVLAAHQVRHHLLEVRPRPQLPSPRAAPDPVQLLLAHHLSGEPGPPAGRTPPADRRAITTHGATSQPRRASSSATGAAAGSSNVAAGSTQPASPATRPVTATTVSASAGPVTSTRLSSRECRTAGSVTANPTGRSTTVAARRSGRDTAGARARPAASSGSGGSSGRSARQGRTATTAAVGSGPYRCGNRMPAGSPGTPGSSRTGATTRAGSTTRTTTSRRPANRAAAGTCTWPGADRCTKPTPAGDGGTSAPVRNASRHSAGVVRCSRTPSLMAPAYRHPGPGRGRGAPRAVAACAGAC